MRRDETALRSAVEAVRLGDLDSFSEIVDDLQPGLTALARGYCRNPEDVLELTQEFFLHLYKKLGKYRGEASFRTWSWSVARNFFRKQVRRRRLPAAELEDADRVADSRTRGAAGQLQDEETRREVEAALNALPDEYRLPLKLFYFEDFSYTEMATVTGLPVNTVKTRLFQGKRRLKEKLGHLGLDWGEEYG